MDYHTLVSTDFTFQTDPDSNRVQSGYPAYQQPDTNLVLYRAIPLISCSRGINQNTHAGLSTNARQSERASQPRLGDARAPRAEGCTTYRAGRLGPAMTVKWACPFSVICRKGPVGDIESARDLCV